MKPGDMVTLSAAALKRDGLYWWSEHALHLQRPKPIGLVTEIKSDRIVAYQGKAQDVFVVRWITPDAPDNREGTGAYSSWVNVRHANEFYRRDLKFVSRRKSKQK